MWAVMTVVVVMEFTA
ncbi:hypothetical protein A2U01_0112550, partial [Trifolium medium]|nr:hypothetical protein [Trifolium medium]